MSNSGTSFGRHAKRGDPRVIASFEGWHHALWGAPPALFWVDHPNRILAAAYHNGRLLALEAKTLGIQVPGWNSPNEIPPRIKALRTALAIRAVEEDKPTATMLSGFMTERRPAHLIEADLRNDLIAKGLGALAQEPKHEVY
jgi:hypothetical protein